MKLYVFGPHLSPRGGDNISVFLGLIGRQIDNKILILFNFSTYKHYNCAIIYNLFIVQLFIYNKRLVKLRSYFQNINKRIIDRDTITIYKGTPSCDWSTRVSGSYMLNKLIVKSMEIRILYIYIFLSIYLIYNIFTSMKLSLPLYAPCSVC